VDEAMGHFVSRVGLFLRGTENNGMGYPAVRIFQKI
jgi:hypothetical protein